MIGREQEFVAVAERRKKREYEHVTTTLTVQRC